MNPIPLKLSVTTCYLLPAGDRFILVDTGYEEDWELFQRRLKEAKVSLSQVTHIFLTHHHDDHCGLLHSILEQNGSIRVVMSEACGELIRRGENDRTHGGGLLNRRVSFLIRHKQAYVSMILRKKVDRSKNLKFAPYEARERDVVFQGEPELRTLGIPLDGKVLATPGHTLDSVSILFPDGNCLAGDAAAHMLPFAGTRYCVIFVSDLEAYYHSWEKLIRAGAKRIFPAHGNPFSADRLVRNLWRNQAEDIVQG